MRLAHIALALWLSAASASAEVPPAPVAPPAAPLEQVQTIALPGVTGRIDHMAIDREGNRLFVAALGNGSVEVIDLAAGKVVSHITGLKEPQGVAYLADLKRLAVACGGDGSVRFYDGTTLQPLKTLDFKEDADNLRYHAGSKRLYVGYGGGALGIIDAEKMERLGDISLQGHPESFQLELRGSRIFVNVPAARHVVVIDRDKERAIAQWPTGARDNFPMAFDEAGRRLYVGCRNPAQVLVFDTESGKAVARLDSPGDADDLFFDPAARRLYVSGGNGSVSVFERTTGDEHRLLGKIETAGMARTSLLAPETGFYYVAAPHRLPLAHEAQIRVFKVKP